MSGRVEPTTPRSVDARRTDEDGVCLFITRPLRRSITIASGSCINHGQFFSEDTIPCIVSRVVINPARTGRLAQALGPCYCHSGGPSIRTNNSSSYPCGPSKRRGGGSLEGSARQISLTSLVLFCGQPSVGGSQKNSSNNFVMSREGALVLQNSGEGAHRLLLDEKKGLHKY